MMKATSTKVVKVILLNTSNLMANSTKQLSNPLRSGQQKYCVGTMSMCKTKQSQMKKKKMLQKD